VTYCVIYVNERDSTVPRTQSFVPKPICHVVVMGELVSRRDYCACAMRARAFSTIWILSGFDKWNSPPLTEVNAELK